MRVAPLLLLVYPLILALPQTDVPTEGKLQRMATGYSYLTAIAWSAPENALYAADRPAGAVFRITATGAAKMQMSVHAGGVAADAEARLWIADGKARRVVRLDKRGKQDLVVSEHERKSFNGPSDIAVTRNGHVFFADPAWASADERKPLPFYGIFHLTPKGVLTLAVRLTSRPAGLAITADGKTLYASLADKRQVSRWAVDKDGVLSGQQSLITNIDGVPDGLSVGADGRIYVAAREVFVYSPEGKLLNTIHVPEKATDCEFGEDGATLFISTGVSLYRWRLDGGDLH